MKKIHWIITLLLLLVVPSACTEQMYNPDAGDDAPEGMVRLRITPTMLDQTVVVTPSSRTAVGAGESTIANCRVLVFDKDPNSDINTTLSQPPATPTNITGNNLLDVLLFEEIGVQRYICVLANLSQANLNWLDAQDAGVTYLAIQNHLVNTLPVSGIVRIDPVALPMSGWMTTSVEIKKGTYNPTLFNSPVTLTRSVARIDVDASATKALGAEFKITGAGVANCPRTGTHLPDPAGKLTPWDATRVEACAMQAQTMAIPPLTKLTEKVYAYEHDGAAGSSAEHPLRIVISGIRAGATTESFYGIDIVYEISSGPLKRNSMEIRRNNIYTIKLNKVNKDGYATYEEAARSASFNTTLDADIAVTDPFAHDIVTNGRQYLGVTNTEYVLYPYDNKTSRNLSIASFTYTCDPAWMAGQITLPPGITFPLGTQQRLAVSPYPVQRDLVVDIDSTFIEGVVILHIGNLKKEIKVRRKASTSVAGGVYSNYYAGAPDVGADKNNIFKIFKVGEVVNFSAATSWLKVAITDDMGSEAALSNRVVTGLGGIYVHVANNIAYAQTTTFRREASLYLAGAIQGERVKVHVQQSTSDVYENIDRIKPFAYVGAFWRHNQTAERIIRMFGIHNMNTGEPEIGKNFWWQANVVAGQEWIVMDTEPPGTISGEQVRHLNAGVPNPYGVGDDANTMFGDDIEVSNTCQVNSKQRSVSGKDNYIYFRIGLTGKLASANATPRYGLVMITYGFSTDKIAGYHPIYIRQGEAADYLMRPFDPITRDPFLESANDQYPSRPNAVRISPFNLDAPANANANANDGSYTGSYALPTQGATFTPFPSWSGSYFQGTRNYFTSLIDAYPPSTTTIPHQVNNYATAWNPADEACPRGYRRIHDGDISTQNLTGAIIGSEIRQSLMLFPAQGGDYTAEKMQAALTNQYRGYLADGYFDRLTITDAYSGFSGGTKMTYSIVRQGRAGQAHMGALFFNPNNYASIFLPFAGRWGGASGNNPWFQYLGENVTLATSTPTRASAGDAVWYLWVGRGFAPVLTKDFTSMYPSESSLITSSIRCVRNDRPIIESGGNIPGNNIDNGSGTNIDKIDRNPDPDNLSNISARISYINGSTLQSQVETKYNSTTKRKQIGSIVIDGVRTLSAADYTYLNNWAQGSANNNGTNYTESTLRHIVIAINNAPLTHTIPAGAFTSPRWLTIELRGNVSGIADGAFTSSLTPGLKTLIVASFDQISANNVAFQFTTSGVGLRLNGYELTHANITTKQWKGLTWSAIRKDN